MNKKVSLHTLGCKLNFSESSYIAKKFKEKGYEISDSGNLADIYILNTCSVTNDAEKECRQIIRRFLKKNPEAFIIVTGCYAQLRPDEISEIPGVDVIVGNNEKDKISQIIDNYSKREKPLIFNSPIDEHNDFGVAYSTDADARTRAFLKIQDGCDYVCTYCTIPKARGKSRSLDKNKVLEHFNLLIDQGYKEIVLTGVNVGDFGGCSKEFYTLLKEITQIKKDFRIRISSIEPNLLTDEIIELTAESEKICNHFHIPLQSGSSKILKLMQRRYNLNFFENLINKINKGIKFAGIGIDVIVGFPDETEDDFNECYNFLQELEYSYLHVFTYSERPDTKAINMQGSVDYAVRKNRNKQLQLLSSQKRTAFNNSLLGQNQKVLFENHNYDGIIKGFTDNYVRVQTEYNSNLCNDFALIEIISPGVNISNCRIVES